MKKHLLSCAFFLCTIFAFAQTPPASVPNAPQYYDAAKQYIEYIPGNLPIVISAPHGGKIVASELPTRSGCGTNEEDNNTDILIREIQKQAYAQMGGYPHIIINNLSRSKLDPNRIESVATCNNAVTVPYFTAYHDFIDDAEAAIMAEYGKGLYIDLHGQSHNPERIDVGYNIQYTTLASTLSNSINYSTIENLKNNNIQNLTLEQLVRGNDGLGHLFQVTGGAFYNSTRTPCSSDSGRTEGYRATPSNYNTGCDDRFPGGEYFEGDYYSNVRHGSGDPAVSTALVGGGTLAGGGGTIDGMMTEVNRRVRDLGSVYSGGSSYNRTDSQQPRLYYFAQDYATVIADYIDAHYNDFTVFNYASAVYDVLDADPTPNITGVSGGNFLSTTGLAIDSNTGVIDVSASTVGSYTVTYEVGPSGYYFTTQNVEITDNTLSIEELAFNSIKLYPNPTKETITLKNNGVVDQVNIYNMIGQLVMTFNVTSSETQMNLSSLKDGSYMATFSSKNNQIGSKLILKN